MTDTQTKSKDMEIPFRPVLIIDKPELKDYQACLQHLFVGLADESIQSALICPPDAGAGSVLCPSVELIYHPLLRIPLFRNQNRQSVLEKLTKFKPTVLHCFSSSKTKLTRYLAETLNIPFLLTYNRSTHRKLSAIANSPNCASLLALSRPIAADLERSFKKFNGRIQQFNIGTFVEDDCACFSANVPIRSMVIAQPLTNANDFKGLLNAVRHLVIDGYEFFLAIIGKGSAEREIHRMIHKLGLTQVVTVVGEIEPLRSVFSGADIFIQPHSRAEFNSPLLEAMGVGLAVASCRNGSEYLLVDGETTVFFDPHDELSVYSCLQNLLDNKEFAQQIARNGQQFLRENYTVTGMINSLKKYYLQAQDWHKEQQQTPKQQD
ncbi:MAG: glycosyltransferase family 4 protein [Phycisphaerae bacterium]|nr:glycosyltransferase family 4 protein [Phycisphaerae bacterium]